MSTFEIIILILTHAAAFTLGALVFRNNISAVNSLLSKGKAIVDATGKIVKKG